MRRAKLNFNKMDWAALPKLAAAAVLLTGCFPARSMAQKAGQKTFSSPDAASSALVEAMKSNDEKAMLEILGPDGRQIVYSGDEVEDSENRANFVARYQQMHRLMKEPDGTMVLYIGATNWPAPIPLVHKGSAWYFDTEKGKMEILYRRIGRNEISTIMVCRELAAAEKEYYSVQHNEYAKQIFSDEGQQNGLFWKAADGTPQSPIGPLIAAAVAEGYAKGKNGPPTPYRGYLFHTLTRQGKDAPGGAKNYIVNGKMTEGFAFIAYPAEYRSSGVMTFVVGPDGVVYEKDLGKNTRALGVSLKEFNPGAGWRKAEEPAEETASGQKPN